MVVKMKLPPKAVALSITALLLVVGFATVMTIVDENTSYDKENPIEYDENKLGALTVRSYIWDDDNEKWEWTTHLATDKLFPSETGGTYILDSQQAGERVRQVMVRIGFMGEQSLIKTDGVALIRITTPMDFSRIMYNTSALSSNQWFTQVSPGVWELKISMVDQLKLKSSGITSEYFNIYFQNGADLAGFFPNDGMLEFNVEFFGSPTPVYIGSTIAFVFGLVLIITALFATPFLSKDKIKVFYVTSRQNAQKRRAARAERKRKIKELR